MISNHISQVFKALPAPSLVLLTDIPKFTIAEVNDAYLALVQVTREELVGKGFYEAFPNNPYNRMQPWNNLLEKLIRDKVPNQAPVSKHLLPLNGTGKKEVKYLIATNTPVFNEANEIEYILRSVNDVTEVTLARHTHTPFTTENFLAETLRIARVGSWEADLINETITWSEVAREIHEVAADYRPGFESPMEFYTQPHYRDLFLHAIQETIATGKLFDLELMITTARGNEKWIRITGKTEVVEGICTRIYGAIQDIHDRKVAEERLIESNRQFESLIQTVDGVVWEADAHTFKFNFVSDQVKNILGYTPEEWLREPFFWQNHIHGKDRDDAVSFCQRETREKRNHVFDYRMQKADGTFVWIKDVVSVICEDGEPVLLRGLMVDITGTKRLEDLEHLEKTVLEINSRKGSSLREVLHHYLAGIECIFPHLKCSLLGIKNNRLENWASPSLPDTYVQALEQLEIGEKAGSCGTAAFRKERVIVSDIATDPLWEDYKSLALPYGLRACWSHPIISGDKVMATFAVYYDKINIPDEAELKVIDRVMAILKVVLENRQNSELVQNTAAELAASESRLRGLVEAQTNYVVRTDLTGHYTYYNRKFEEDFGWFYKDESFLGTNCIFSVASSHRQRVFETAAKCVAEPGTVFAVELDHVHPVDGTRSAYWHFIALSTDGETPTEIQCIGIDISEKKRAADALQQSNERYEYVNKATNDAIYDWDMRSDHIAWGDGFQRLFGFAVGQERYPVAKWAESVHPADRERIEQSLRTELDDASQHKWTAMYRFRKVDGTYAHVEEIGYIRRNRVGRPVRMIGVLRDVTRLKQEQHELKLLSSVITNTNDAVLIAESDPNDVTGLKILYVNAAFSRITGYAPGQVVGKSPLVLKGFSPARNDFDRLKDAIRKLEPLKTATMRYTGLGDETFISLSLHPVADERGVLNHWIAIGHDVTDRLRYISEIEEQNHKLQEIAWMQSHVIRAPLARLMGLIDLIKNYQNSETEKNELLDHILTSAYSLDEIIRDISAKTEQI